MLDHDKPNSTSSLINGINILMELFRRYCSEIEHAEFQYHEYLVESENDPDVEILPSFESLTSLSIDTNALFLVLGENLPKFCAYLDLPKDVNIFIYQRQSQY